MKVKIKGKWYLVTVLTSESMYLDASAKIGNYKMSDIQAVKIGKTVFEKKKKK